MPSIVTEYLPARFSLLLSLVCLFIISGHGRCAEPWPSTGPGGGPAYEKIQAALDQDARFEFIETPLDQVVDFLEDQQEIPFELDVIGLDEVGIGTDAPITACIKGVSLGSTLKILLDQLDLTYVIRNEVLMITTPERAALTPEIRVYSVAELLGDDMDIHGLAMTLYQVLQPNFGGAPGVQGPGGMTGYGAGGGFGGSMGGGYFDVQDEGYEEGGYGGYGMGYGDEGAPASTAPVSAVPVPRIIPYRQLLIVRHTTTGQNEFAKLLGAMAEAMKENGR